MQTIPSRPPPFVAISRRMWFTVMGMWFHALYAAMKAREPPSCTPMRNGTEYLGPDTNLVVLNRHDKTVSEC